MTEHKDIHDAKIAVMEAVDYVQKTGQMRGSGNYKYVSVDEVIARLRPEMVAHGIHFAPISMTMLLQETYKSKGYGDKEGTAMNRIILGVSYRLSHVSGTHEDGYSVGEASDAGDKACNKAMTAAKKYALLQSFCLETGEDDPDHSPSSEQERKLERKRPPSNGNGKSDPAATAREEYQAKIMGLSAKALAEKCASFDDVADKAIAHFGGQQHANAMRTATIERMYKMLDLEIGGLSTIKATVDWEAWRAKDADKYLNDSENSVLDAKLERRREKINYDLEHSPG